MTLLKSSVTSLYLTFAFIVNGQSQCVYKIDTAGILANRNLDTFLSELETDSFTVTNNKKDIPRLIKKQLRCMPDGFSIANPGKRYQATDVVVWRVKPLPRRQLIFLAKSKDMLIMTYFIGGIGKSGHILLIKFQDKKILDLWTGYSFNGLETKQSIINTINQNRNREWGLNTNIIYF
jgi:hypothetical protein